MDCERGHIVQALLVKMEVIQISFGEIADEALQPPTLHDGFGFVTIFGRSSGESSPMFSTGE
jgi:hypothetical protein